LLPSVSVNLTDKTTGILVLQYWVYQTQVEFKIAWRNILHNQLTLRLGINISIHLSWNYMRNVVKSWMSGRSLTKYITNKDKLSKRTIKWRGSRGLTPLVFNLCTTYRGVVNLMLKPLYAWRKKPRQPLNRGLKGSRIQPQYKNFVMSQNWPVIFLKFRAYEQEGEIS